MEEKKEKKGKGCCGCGGKKLLSIALTLMFVASAFVILPAVSAQAPPPYYEKHNDVVKDDAIVNDEDTLVVGNTVQIEVDTDYMLLPTGEYYLCRPVYAEDSDIVTYEKVGGALNVGAISKFPAVTFSVAGYWAVANEIVMGTPVDAYYFWVNTSTTYNLALSVSSVEFGSSADITATVTKGGAAVEGAWVDIWGDGIFVGRWDTGADGKATFNVSSFAQAGDYTIIAYKDTEAASGDDQSRYDAYGYYAYDLFTAIIDPPEYNSTSKPFTVEAGTPTITIVEGATQYWGFSDSLEINVTDVDGTGIEGGVVTILNQTGKWFAYDMYSDDLNGNYSFYEDWKNGKNGTWKIIFSYDDNGDGIEEWNGSKTFTVTSATNLVIKDETESVDVQEYGTGGEYAGVTTISFRVFNKTGEELDNGYLTGSENFTISGDLLYAPDAPIYTGGAWVYTVCPKRGDGTITIAVDWWSYSTSFDVEVDLGAVVEFTTGDMVVDQNMTATVNVKDRYGNAVPDARVLLFWNYTGETVWYTEMTGTGASGKGLNGNYNIPLNTTNVVFGDNFTFADLENQIVAYATIGHDGNYQYGYDMMNVNRNHDLQVAINNTKALCEEYTSYTINVTTVAGGYPLDSGMNVEILDEDGNLVAGFTDLLNDTVDVRLPYGTYTVYAYNDTHDSRGNNKTITVTNATVTFSPAKLVWLYDTNSTVEFTVKWDGALVGNGTLYVYGIYDGAGAYDNETTMDALDYIEIEIVNGVGKIMNINATTIGNLTFEFKSDVSGSAANGADGKLPVTWPTIAIDPAKIFVGESNSVIVTVTHPADGSAIEGANITLFGQSIESDEEGNCNFVLFPTVGGKIYAYYEAEKTEYFTEAVKGLYTMLSAAEVKVGETLTVTVFQRGTTLQAVAGATVTINGATQTTDVTGKALFTMSTVGTYSVAATKATYEPATPVSVTVATEAVIEPATFTYTGLIITPTEGIEVGDTITVEVTVKNVGDVAGFDVAVLKVNGKSVASQITESLAANGVAQITFTYTFTEAGTFPVTIGSATAQNVVVSEKSEPAVPGFEALFLIGAIAVAMLLLRKKH